MSLKPQGEIGGVKSIAKTMRNRREALGLSQSDVALKLGLKADFIGLCEKDQRWIGLDRIPRLAEILEVNPKDLAIQALSEEAPELVQVLLTGKLSKDFDPQLPGNSAQESFRKLMALDRSQRQPLLDTIDTLYDMMTSLQSRTLDKSPVEKPIPRIAGSRR